jgi:hypothetical protein
MSRWRTTFIDRRRASARGRRLRRGVGGVLLGGLPFLLAGSLDGGAAASTAPQPPPGTASVRPDAAWLRGLTGPVQTRRGALPADEVPPNTPVTPVSGDPQVLVLAGPAGTQLSAPSGSGNTGATAALTSSGIPVRMLRAYVEAAQVMAARDAQCKIPWSLLAGIGRVETNHGRFGGAVITASGRVSPPIYGPLLNGNGFPAIRDTDGGRLDGNAQFDRAVGPMQFIPGTWAMYGADGNGDGVADPQNVDDAALAAARYLCAGGGDLSTQTGRWNAVYRYNHSASYVSLVLGLADSYATGTPTALPSQPAGVVTPSGPPASVGKPPAVVLVATGTGTSTSPSATGSPASSGTGTSASSPAVTPSPDTGTTTSPATTSTSDTGTTTPTPTDTGTTTPTPSDTTSPAGTTTPTPTPSATPTSSGTTSPAGTTTPTPAATGTTTPTPSDTSSATPTA